MIYPDAKHEGELAAFAAGDRLGVDVVSVNPAYVLGAALNRRLPGETSTRLIGNYLRGRLPAIIDSYTNIVDVEDVAAGHLLAAEARPAGRALHPRQREHALVGGDRARRTALGRASPAGVCRPRPVGAAELRSARGADRNARGHPADVAGLALLVGEGEAGAGLQSRAARRETLEDTVAWYLELIEDDRLPAGKKPLVRPDERGLRPRNGCRLLAPLKAAGDFAGRRT